MVCKIFLKDAKPIELAFPLGSCRLIGRELDSSGTLLLASKGTRKLEASEMAIIEQHLNRKGNSTVVAKASNLAGFTRESDIIVADQALSRAHAIIFFDNDGAGIIDLGSTNGTFVNSQRISISPLQHNDIISLGESRIEVILN